MINTMHCNQAQRAPWRGSRRAAARASVDWGTHLGRLKRCKPSFGM